MTPTQTTATGGWKARDKAYRAQQNERARHNRLMKSDPEYRASFIAKRNEEGQRRHLAHIEPIRRRKGLLLMALLGLDVSEVAG